MRYQYEDFLTSTHAEAKFRFEWETEGPYGDKDYAFAGPLLIRANEQTAGRGSGRKSWFSPPGGLYMSVVLRSYPVSPALAALKVATILGKTVVAVQPPNDLVIALDSRIFGKVGGILCEQLSDNWMIISLGLNAYQYQSVSYVQKGVPDLRIGIYYTATDDHTDLAKRIAEAWVEAFMPADLRAKLEVDFRAGIPVPS